MQGGREQQRLVHIRGSKALSHGRILSPNSLWKSCHVWCLGGIYSRQTPSETQPLTRLGLQPRPCLKPTLNNDDRSTGPSTSLRAGSKGQRFHPKELETSKKKGWKPHALRLR